MINDHHFYHHVIIVIIIIRVIMIITIRYKAIMTPLAPRQSHRALWTAIALIWVGEKLLSHNQIFPTYLIVHMPVRDILLIE